MEMDVNLSKVGAIELVGISGMVGGGRGLGVGRLSPLPAAATTAPVSPVAETGCCSFLSMLMSCTSTSSSSSNNNYNSTTRKTASLSGARKSNYRTPQEIYFESRGKSCKKLLKFNGNSNKILLYPEEGWARTASSSYWTITPCWWQPNRCRIEEFMGSQRNATKAKMLPLEQKGSLLILGNFSRQKCKDSEFKLYLSSNISIEDYNMGYCLTGFVERRCQQTNTFQMTHFAVIKRQWPSISNDSRSTT